MIRAAKLFGKDGVFHVPKTSRILIFRGGALGDFILTIPPIPALRWRWPNAYIELAGHERSACLALTTGLIDRLRPLDSARLAYYFQSKCELPPEEKEYIRSFDLIISYLHDPGEVLLKHLKNAGAKNIIAVSPVEIKGHAADHFFSALNSVLGEGTGECPPAMFEWPESLKRAARRRLSAEIGKKQVIIIHPGSGSPAKNWPAGKFTELAKKIRDETSFEPLIIGGEADIKPIAVMRSLLPDYYFTHRYFRKTGQAPPALPNRQWRCGDAHALPVERLSPSVVPDYLSLTEVASILSVAGGFVGNDSGITHLAAAMGIPVVALFGPTDPAIWAPRGKNVFIIKSRLSSNESLAEIGVETVFQALKASAG